MKIAILTLPLHTNYGGILQAYALQTVLERMGHEVSVITRDKRIPITARLLFLSIPKRILLSLFGNRIDVFHELKWNRRYKIISKNVAPFINKYIKQDNRFLTAIKPSDYDIFVVGSDQIWRPKYIRNTLRSSVQNAYLDFAKKWDIRRIAYGASFGTDEWEYSNEETEILKPLIEKFDAISVREMAGIRLCNDYLGVSAKLVLDPTLLLNDIDYSNLCPFSYNKKGSGALFYYVLDITPEIEGFIDRVGNERNLEPRRVGARVEDWTAPLSECIQPPVETWLTELMESDMVVTDSFHACVFSIIFHKPFIAIGNVKRGLSRFSSLLGQFGLESHMLTDLSQYNSNCDYSIPNEVYPILDCLRNQSFEYLRSSIDKCDMT